MRSITYNIVRDYDKVQGTTHPSDVTIPRDINYRYISIENSALRKFAIALTTYYSGPKPLPQFYMEPGEIRQLSINSHDQALQFIHIFDPNTKEYVGQPSPLRTNSNSFVIRDGINKVWIDYFYRATYRSSF